MQNAVSSRDKPLLTHIRAASNLDTALICSFRRLNYWQMPHSWMSQTVPCEALGRELLDGGRNTTRNPGDEARTKRENDIKRRTECSSKQGMARDQLKLKTLNDNP